MSWHSTLKKYGSDRSNCVPKKGLLMKPLRQGAFLNNSQEA